MENFIRGSGILGGGRKRHEITPATSYLEISTAIWLSHGQNWFMLISIIVISIGSYIIINQLLGMTSYCFSRVATG